jgi:hypothetical protein
MSRYHERYVYLRAHNFLPLEARELARLPKATPALRSLIEDRDVRRARFERLAATKIAYGKWRRADVEHKWRINLSRLYHNKNWRVKEGARGNQQRMPKYSPNPWAMYRGYIKQVGDKNYVSPWELKQLRKGKTLLDKGLIFVQSSERTASAGGAVNKGMIRQWMDEKNIAIKKARGANRTRLQQEYHRLEKLL